MTELTPPRKLAAAIILAGAVPPKIRPVAVPPAAAA